MTSIHEHTSVEELNTPNEEGQTPISRLIEEQRLETLPKKFFPMAFLTVYAPKYLIQASNFKQLQLIPDEIKTEKYLTSHDPENRTSIPINFIAWNKQLHLIPKKELTPHLILLSNIPEKDRKKPILESNTPLHALIKEITGHQTSQLPLLPQKTLLAIENPIKEAIEKHDAKTPGTEFPEKLEQLFRQAKKALQKSKKGEVSIEI